MQYNPMENQMPPPLNGGLKDCVVPAPVETEMDRLLGELAEISAHYGSQWRQLNEVLTRLRGVTPEKEPSPASCNGEPSTLGKFRYLLDDVQQASKVLDAALEELDRYI